MMTQEEFMDVVRMHAEGMSFTEIAAATGYHRTTIAQWIKQGGVEQLTGPQRVVKPEQAS